MAAEYAERIYFDYFCSYSFVCVRVIYTFSRQMPTNIATYTACLGLYTLFTYIYILSTTHIYVRACIEHRAERTLSGIEEFYKLVTVIYGLSHILACTKFFL